MKALQIFLMITAVFLTNALAQSGRRVQNVRTAEPSSTPQVQETESSKEQIKQEESAGYSESTPTPRSLYPTAKKDKKSKKDEKKDAKKDNKTQTPTTATTDTTTATTNADGSTEDNEVIKVETNLVTIPVSVNDRNGFYVPNLSKQNFKIFENGVEQEVTYFGTSDQPFSVVLLIDVSPSTTYKIDEIQSAAMAFVGQLQPQDKVMVIEFDSSVNVLTEMTGDRDKIAKAIRRAGFGGGTSLYEAVDVSLRRHLNKIEGRKAVVLFTDGVDTSSERASFEGTIRDAEESEAVIFPIYYNTFLNNMGIGGGGGAMSTPPILGMPGTSGQGNGSSSAEYTRGRAYLNELATVSGGKVFRPESTPGGLTAAFESIADELRRQYTLGYSPSESGTTGERRAIKVRVDRPKLIIRARDSYIVGGGS